MTDIAFILSGFFVGFVVGLTGVGGGSLMTPILIFGFGIKPILAVGTDLLFAAFTKLGGTVNLTLARRVDWKIVGALSLGSIPAALLTVWGIHAAGAANETLQKTMISTLGVALLLTAAATLYKAIKGVNSGTQRELTLAELARAT
ncbi:MAG: TSUP family transporter, partial [Brachymonas sp.]